MFSRLSRFKGELWSILQRSADAELDQFIAARWEAVYGDTPPKVTRSRLVVAIAYELAAADYAAAGIEPSPKFTELRDQVAALQATGTLSSRDFGRASRLLWEVDLFSLPLAATWSPAAAMLRSAGESS